MNMDTRTVVVTGSGQGIGRAIAVELANRGDHVVVADLSGERANAVVDEITADGGKARALVVDIADSASCRAAARELLDTVGTVDGLVNNAAMFSTLTMKPFWEIPEAEWQRVVQVNLTGTWQVTTALLPLLRRSAAGAIVNIAASAVWIGRPHYAHYVASKAGVIGLTYAMSRELADDGIRVNAVTPGSVRTEIPRDTITPAQVAAQVAAQSVRRPAGPADLVGAVAFLLGRDSAFISGQTLNVDGGLTVR
jgi:3-oxoacyl-[acyl-carrier protein] reductase